MAMAKYTIEIEHQAVFLAQKYNKTLWFIVTTKKDFETIYNKKSWIAYELEWLKYA